MQAVQATLMAGPGTTKITRDELMLVPVPESTLTHQPVAHHSIVTEVEQALAMRQINIVEEEFAVSADGAKMFGLLVLEAEFDGCRFAIGLRNSHDKSMRLSMVAGYRVLVCSNMAFSGDFSRFTAKHTKGFTLQDSIALGVDRMHRNFASVQLKVSEWKRTRLLDERAKEIIYDAFTSRSLRLHGKLFRMVDRHYFNPIHQEFEERSMWSLSNAFTSSFKELLPVRQFEATARIAPFLESYQG